MNGVFEIYATKEWMILPSFVHGILPTVMYNSNNHTMLGIDREKKSPMAINAAGKDIFREYEVTDDGTVLPAYDGWNDINYLKELKQPFVNVIPIDGPITRNGGACSYGSRDIRDWLMMASDNPYCQGHVLLVKTPGGSAWAKNDFQQGIDYAHAKGLRVIDLIDGMSASAGEYLASLCDEVYAMNPKDQLGCVGVMASFFTQKNGEKNQFTGETYREYYATKSINKNKEIRDIAENDDATLLIQELDELEAEFRADMKKAFPNVTDEYLDGKMFDAKDVMGILCDGQMMLGDVIARVFALADGSEKPIERTAGRKMGKRVKAAAMSNSRGGTAVTQQAMDEKAGGGGAVTQQAMNEKAGGGAAVTQQAMNENINLLNNSINMKEKFPNVFALLGVEEMECGEEGSFFNAGLLQTLEGKIGEMQSANAEAKALVEQLTAEKTALEQQLTEKDGQMAQQLAEKDGQMEQLKADHQTAVETLKAEHEKALGDAEIKHKEAIAANAALLEEKDNTIKELNEAVEGYKQAEVVNAENMQKMQQNLDGAQASLETATQTIAERDQQISDLTAQVEELTKEPGNEPQAGAAPQNNGGGAEAPTVAVNQYVYDPSKPYKENMAAMEKWNKEHGK